VYREQQAINPSQLVELSDLVETVKEASTQLEKIINLFVQKVEDVEGEERLHHNLDLSTLKYIVETDPCKVLLFGTKLERV
jgi:hypothetical protein